MLSAETAKKYTYKQLSSDFHNVFGSTMCLDTQGLQAVQRSGWQGETCLSLRGLSWRVWLGLLPQKMTLWPQKLEQDFQKYEQLKAMHLPDINKVQVDPLSGMSSCEEGGQGGDWDAYYKVRLSLFEFS